jgi:hypothetical protein
MLSTPLVSRDLTAGRCYLDIAHALEALDGTIGAVLDRISSRAEAERLRVAAINERVLSCEAKVAAIGAMRNRATTVMSTSRYPDDRGAGEDADVVSLVAEPGAGREKSDSTSLQRECSARARSGKSIHASRALREMIARPKISRNERKTAEIGASKVENFALLSCPGSAPARPRSPCTPSAARRSPARCPGAATRYERAPWRTRSSTRARSSSGAG